MEYAERPLKLLFKATNIITLNNIPDSAKCVQLFGHNAKLVVVQNNAPTIKRDEHWWNENDKESLVTLVQSVIHVFCFYKQIYSELSDCKIKFNRKTMKFKITKNGETHPVYRIGIMLL